MPQSRMWRGLFWIAAHRSQGRVFATLSLCKTACPFIFRPQTLPAMISKFSKKTVTPVALFSPLDPIALAIILRDEMELSKKRSGNQVFGRGTERSMWLTYSKRRGGGNRHVFAPKLKATMQPHDGGTLIKGEITQYSRLFPFIILWVAFLLPFAIGTQFIWLSSAPIWFCALIASIAPAMIAFGLYLAPLSKEPKPPKDTGKPEHILDWLNKTVQAKSVNNG